MQYGTHLLSIRYLVMVTALLFGVCGVVYGQSIVWEHLFVGNQVDIAKAVAETQKDYFVAGYSYSADSNFTGSLGGADGWVARFSKDGSLIQKETYGGEGNDFINAMAATPDGGVICAGSTASRSIDTGTRYSSDLWLMKLAADGKIMWQRLLGGNSTDEALDVITTTDGGFAVTGSTESHDGDIASSAHPGATNSNVWILKFDSIGTLEWQKVLGSTWYDKGQAIIQTFDAGFLVGGTAGSDVDFQSKDSARGKMLIKLDRFGTVESVKVLGSTFNDVISALVQTDDSLIVFTGSAFGNIAPADFHIELGKVDPGGDFRWNNPYADGFNEWGNSIFITANKTLLVSANMVIDFAGYADAWLAIYTTDGEMLWSKTFGTDKLDFAAKAIETSDGGFLLVGGTSSNKLENTQEYDAWIVKISNPLSDVKAEPLTTASVRSYPNPSPGIVHFRLEGNNELRSIELYNEIGQHLFTQKGDVTTIDLSSYPCGNYFYRLNTTNEQFDGVVTLIK